MVVTFVSAEMLKLLKGWYRWWNRHTFKDCIGLCLVMAVGVKAGLKLIILAGLKLTPPIQGGADTNSGFSC